MRRKNLFLVIFLFCFIFFLGLAVSVLAGDEVGLTNPLTTADPRVIIGYVIKAALGIVGSLALAVFILGGLTWVTSAGNEEKVKKGKDMLMWAVFGLAVVFLSYALVTFVINAIGGSGTGANQQTGGGASQQTGS